METAINKLRSFVALAGRGPIVFAAALFPLVVQFAACSSGSHSTTPHPPKMLLGRWQSKPTQHHVYALFEFSQDGNVVELFKPTMQKVTELSHWDQCATGTFRFIDPTHLEIHLMAFQERSCRYGSSVWSEQVGVERFYKLDWLDDDHVRLGSGRRFSLRTTGGETIELNRLN